MLSDQVCQADRLQTLSPYLQFDFTKEGEGGICLSQDLSLEVGVRKEEISRSFWVFSFQNDRSISLRGGLCSEVF